MVGCGSRGRGAADRPFVMGLQVGKTTRAQREEVVQLREADMPIRAIAAQVFGDARYRGRVERILASREIVGGTRDVAGLEGLEPLEAIRILYERRLAVLLEGEAAPSMTELQKLLEVQRQLDGFAALERLRGLTAAEV